MKLLLLFIIIISAFVNPANSQTSDKIAASVIKLYPDKIPNEIAGPDSETTSR